MTPTAFFAYARLRHEAYLAKQRGMPIGKQSFDPILNQYRFTNVFRELDKTTRWFADHVREPMRDKPEVLLATVLFRLLNRIEVGEAIFVKNNGAVFYELAEAETAMQVTKALKNIERAIVKHVGSGPYCTGAYIITSPPGLSKLPGMMKIVKMFWIEYYYPNIPVTYDTLESAWESLKTNAYFGPFHSYEMVTDLRFTSLLENAPDIMTWANPGPGARRGLNRVHGRDVGDHTASREQMIKEMQELLKCSKLDRHWPKSIRVESMWKYDHPWPSWEMRDVEHTLCEYDKYCRVKLGEGRPRGVYR